MTLERQLTGFHPSVGSGNHSEQPQMGTYSIPINTKQALKKETTSQSAQVTDERFCSVWAHSSGLPFFGLLAKQHHPQCILICIGTKVPISSEEG